MSKDFEAMLAQKKVIPLSAEDRARIMVSYGKSWKFANESRYEETILLLEAELRERPTTCHS